MDDLQGLQDKIKKLEDQTRTPSTSVSKPNGCSFSASIVKEPLSAHYKSAKMSSYDGSGDPD